MPALRLSLESEAKMALKKKILMLEDGYDENNNSNSLDQDTFGDTSVQQASTRSQNAHQLEDLVEVFKHGQGLASPQDQFAAALLRLQLELDAAGERLSAVERKLEQAMTTRQQRAPQVTPARSDPLISGRTLTTGFIYLAWPVVVFAAMRAYERRASKLGA